MEWGLWGCGKRKKEGKLIFLLQFFRRCEISQPRKGFESRLQPKCPCSGKKKRAGVFQNHLDSLSDAVNLHEVYHTLRSADAFNLNHINRTHSADIIKAAHEKKRWLFVIDVHLSCLLVVGRKMVAG